MGHENQQDDAQNHTEIFLGDLSEFTQGSGFPFATFQDGKVVPAVMVRIERRNHPPIAFSTWASEALFVAAVLVDFATRAIGDSAASGEIPIGEYEAIDERIDEISGVVRRLSECTETARGSGIRPTG